MSYLYDRSGQIILFQREESYGKTYDPEASGITAWTKLPEDYAHWRRLDYITSSIDVVIPKIEKIKQYDLSDSKHASAIAEGNIEPQDITLSMDAQGLEFLPCAIGNPAYSSHGQAMTQVLTFTTAKPTQGDYFLFDTIDSDGDVEHWGVWSDTANDQSTGKPTVIGINATNMIPANTSTATTVTNCADAVETIIESECSGDITSANNVAGVLTLIHARDGAVQPAHDSEEGAFDVAVGVTTWGSTTFTVTELLDTTLPSFTLHFEQTNTTSADDIAYDVFGCVVSEIVVKIGFADKIVKYDVTFSCPYAVEGETALNPPSKKMIDFMPSMNSLIEANNECLLQAGTTSTVDGADDHTPNTVDSVSLTISNNVTFQPNIEAQHMKTAIAGKRDVSLNIVGATDEKDLFNFWQEKYKLSGSDYIPNSASERINSVFKLQRDATYDYISIAIYNWLCEEHNFKFMDVSESVKMVDMTLTDGSGNSAGRILTSTTFVTYIDKCVMDINA